MSKDWRHSAACRNEDPELFFAPGVGGPALVQIAEAKAVCGRCLVSTACLEWALGSGQDYGVFGGKTEDERREIRRKRRGLAVVMADAERAAARAANNPAAADKSRGDVLRLHDAGLAPDQIALRLGLRTRQVRQWITKRNIEAAA